MSAARSGFARRALLVRTLPAVLAGVCTLAAVAMATSSGRCTEVARAADPADDGAARAETIETLLSADRWQTALEEARAAEPLASGQPRLSAAIARALFRAGRLPEAEQRLERLADGQAGNEVPALAWVVLARLRAARGRGEEADSAMERALQLAPEDPEVAFWSAELAPNRAESCRRLERFLSLSRGADPDREEAARGSLRIYRELGERRIWRHEMPDGPVEIPLTPIWTDSGRRLGYVIDLRIGDRRRPVRVLLDTGSGGLFLMDRLARKRGLRPLGEETTFGGGGRGRHRSRRGLFDELSVGPLRFADAMATTSDVEIEPHGRYGGVLGLSAFAGYEVTLDFPGKRMILDPRPATVERAAAEPYWDLSGQLLVTATITGDRPATFLLDTGANATVVAESLADDTPGARGTSPASVRGFGGAMRGARTVEGIEVAFEGRTVGAGGLGTVDLSLRGRLAGVELGGYLGMDLLEEARVVIDTRRRTVELRDAGSRHRSAD